MHLYTVSAAEEVVPAIKAARCQGGYRFTVGSGSPGCSMEHLPVHDSTVDEGGYVLEADLWLPGASLAKAAVVPLPKKASATDATALVFLKVTPLRGERLFYRSLVVTACSHRERLMGENHVFDRTGTGDYRCCECSSPLTLTDLGGWQHPPSGSVQTERRELNGPGIEVIRTGTRALYGRGTSPILKWPVYLVWLQPDTYVRVVRTRKKGTPAIRTLHWDGIDLRWVTGADVA